MSLENASMRGYVIIGEVYFGTYGGLIVADPERHTGGLRADKIAEEPGYKLVEVKFYIGFGWLADDELLTLRQTNPRMAP